MIVGQRIKARLPIIGISAAELARRVGMSQSAIANLIAGRIRSTSNLHKIARELATTSEYLTGEVDDPDEGAPPPKPQPPTAVFLRVELPTEDALTAMFDALLDGVDREAPQVEQARQLAQQLPIGLSHFADARPAPKRHRRSLEVVGSEEPSRTLGDGRRS